MGQGGLPDDTPRPTRYGGNQLTWRQRLRHSIIIISISHPAPCLCSEAPSPSVKPMDATTGSGPPQAYLAPLQPKRRRRRLKIILRSIAMPPERAALLDATPPSE